MNGSLHRLREARQARAPQKVMHVGCQSWTAKNLCVESYHEDILYYTTRWDALCPYIDVSEEMLATAPRPFVVYALPPDSQFGVAINDKYGMVDCFSEAFWTEERRARKFKEYDKQYRNFTISMDRIPGKDLTIDDIFEMGGEHFEKCFIADEEVAGFVDYIRTLDVLVITVVSPEGELVLTDVSVVLPKIGRAHV